MFTSDMKLKNETVIGACFTHSTLGSWLRNFIPYVLMLEFLCMMTLSEISTILSGLHIARIYMWY